MKTIQINVYPFSELSDEAKKVAREWYRNTSFENGFAWSDEAYDSLKAFCKRFGIKYRSACFSQYSEVNYSLSDIDDTILDLSGKRLISYLWNYDDLIIQRKTYWFVRKPDGTRYMNAIGQNSGKYVSKCQYQTASCPLTGVCFDDDLLEPIQDAVKKGYDGTFGDLLDDCISAWVKSANADCEAQLSDSYIDEHLEINNYEFTEDGKRY